MITCLDDNNNIPETLGLKNLKTEFEKQFNELK